MTCINAQHCATLAENVLHGKPHLLLLLLLLLHPFNGLFFQVNLGKPAPER